MSRLKQKLYRQAKQKSRHTWNTEGIYSTCAGKICKIKEQGLRGLYSIEIRCTQDIYIIAVQQVNCSAYEWPGGRNCSCNGDGDAEAETVPANVYNKNKVPFF